jgi:hypothetical protein
MRKPTKEDQEMFDTMVRGLASQGWERSLASVEMSDRCAYRGDEGRKCAVGWLIPDEAYRPEMEGWPVLHVLEECAVPSSMAYWIRRAQLEHDTRFGCLNMRGRFQALADRLGFDWPSEEESDV